MTHEPTFLGVSRNALYRIDPRLAGSKLVDSQLKQYVSKNDFSALATTEKGYVAVASNKGDIRLFDRLGINAKTHIPALGEPIIGLDVSADGHWVLGTCRTYLLLIDAMQKSGKNEGKLGFERSFAADSKPQPRRLALTPEHVAQFAHETGKGVSFTPAKFNTGAGAEETSIITATGPYVIEWNLRKVLRGHQDAYMIKRYTGRGQGGRLQVRHRQEHHHGPAARGEHGGQQVAAAAHAREQSPASWRLPQAAGARVRGGARAVSAAGLDSGRYKLGKDDVVNSPY